MTAPMPSLYPDPLVSEHLHVREMEGGGCMRGRKSGGWRVHEGDEEWRVEGR